MSGTTKGDETFTKIPNSVLEALCRAELSSREMRVMLFLGRQTFGFHRDRAPLSLSKFSAALGLHRRHVWQILRDLKVRNFIVTFHGYKRRLSYGFQTDSKLWRPRSAMQKTNDADFGTIEGDKVYPPEVPTLSPLEVPPALKENKKKEVKENAQTAFSLNGEKPGASRNGSNGSAGSLFAEFLQARAHGCKTSYQRWIAGGVAKKGITVEDVLRIFPGAKVMQ